MYNAVGIDASKLKSTITIIQPAGVVIRNPFDVLHTSDELNTLVTYLKSLVGETRAVIDIDQVDQRFNSFAAPHHITAERPESFLLIVTYFNILPK